MIKFKYRKRILLLSFWVLLIVINQTQKSQSRETQQLELSGTRRLFEGTELILNGYGVYSKFIFSIYGVYFYTPYKIHEPQKLLDLVFSDNNYMLADMKFLRNIGRDTLKKAWRQSFYSNCEQYCTAATKDFEEVVSRVVDVKYGDRILFIFKPQSFEVQFGAERKTYQNEALARSILLTWIGVVPPSERFKRHLLGN